MPKPVVLVVGTTGSGKSSLINTVFGEKVAQEGTGKPVTTHFQRYEPSSIPVIIYDSKGLEQGNTAEFIETTSQFFSKIQADPKERVNIVWYVINGAGSRIQPFEVEVWNSLLKNVPILFIINKADISTEADRDMIRQNILTKCPERAGQNCIFDAVSGSREPILNVTCCGSCGSDDIEVRRRKGTATCAACGTTFSIFVENGVFITKTLDFLPQVKREAFINAQSYSCGQKDERAFKIITEFYCVLKELKTINESIYTFLTTAMVRLAVLWKFQHYGVETSHSIAYNMLKKLFKLSKIKRIFYSSSLKVNYTIPILTLWNRCLRSLFIMTSSSVVEGKDLDGDQLAKTVEKAFDCLNEEEVAAVTKFLSTPDTSLDSLLKREMPKDPNGKPCIPEPFVLSHSAEVKKILLEEPVEVISTNVPSSSSLTTLLPAITTTTTSNASTTTTLPQQTTPTSSPIKTNLKSEEGEDGIPLKTLDFSSSVQNESKSSIITTSSTSSSSLSNNTNNNNGDNDELNGTNNNQHQTNNNIGKDLLNLPIKVKNAKNEKIEKEDDKLINEAKAAIQNAIQEEVRNNQKDDEALMDVLDKQLNFVKPPSPSLPQLPQPQQQQQQPSSSSLSTNLSPSTTK